MDDFKEVTGGFESVSADVEKIKNSYIEMSGLEEQLNDAKNKIQFVQLGSQTRLMLENKINKLQSEINEKKEKTREEYNKAEGKFENSKKDFIKNINEEMSYFRPKAEIEQEKSDIKAEKNNWTRILQINRQKMQNEINKMNDEGTYIDADSLNSYKQKIHTANEKLKEIAKKEEKADMLLPIEDNQSSIYALEHIKMIYQGLKFSDLFSTQKINQLENTMKTLATEMRDEQNDKDIEPLNAEEHDEILKSNDNEPDNIEYNEKRTGNDDIEPKGKIESKDFDTDHEPKEVNGVAWTNNTRQTTNGSERSNNISSIPTIKNRQLKGIYIDKYGIKILNNDDKGIAFKSRIVKENLNMSLDDKKDMLCQILQLSNADATSIELLNKIDPNVLFALQKAQKEYGVGDYEIKTTLANYMNALDGNKEAQSAMKGFITYDRSRMDYMRPTSFFGILMHKKEYQQLKKYQQDAKGFAKVINDVKAKTISEWIHAHTIKKLQEKTEEVSDSTSSKAEKINNWKEDLRTGVDRTGISEIGNRWQKEESKDKDDEER